MSAPEPSIKEGIAYLIISALALLVISGAKTQEPTSHAIRIAEVSR